MTPPGEEDEDNAVLDAIAADRRLTSRQRKALAEIYESFIASSPAGKRIIVVTSANAQQGKAALVTGAASGIGRAVAERLVRPTAWTSCRSTSRRIPTVRGSRSRPT